MRFPSEGGKDELKAMMVSAEKEMRGWLIGMKYRESVFLLHFHLFVLAVLSLHRCIGASSVVQSKGYSSCDTKASSCSGFSCCGAAVVGPTASFSLWPQVSAELSLRIVHGLQLLQSL